MQGERGQQRETDDRSPQTMQHLRGDHPVWTWTCREQSALWSSRYNAFDMFAFKSLAMPQLASRLLIWSLLCLLSPLAFGQAQSTNFDAVAESFVHAWNEHDMEAFGRLFAVDADWVTASGVHLTGRKDIQAYLTQEHSTWAKATTMKAMDTRVRRISADMAVVVLQWQIEGAPEPASKEVTITRGNNLFVTTRQHDGWSIVAGQVASRRAGTPARQ